MRKISILFLIGFSFQVSAGDLGFRYKGSKCVNTSGVAGLNPSFFGQCGDLRQVTLGNFKLEGIDFSGSQFTGSNVQLSSFNGSNLTGANFEGANLAGVSFLKSQIINVNLKRTNLKNAQFAGATIQSTDFSFADLSRTALSYVKVTDALFFKTKFDGVVLDNAELVGCNLESVEFTGANLVSLNLVGGKLKKVKFTGANLTAAKFQGVVGEELDFSSATLRHIDLTGATLAATTFRGSVMENSILVNGIFEGADFRGAILKDSQISNTGLKGALFNRRTQMPFSREDAEKLGMKFVNTRRVLVLWQSKTPAVDSFKTDLEGKDVEVVMAAVADTAYVGADLSDVDVIFYANGISFNRNMPDAGQAAIVKFVNEGGTFIHTEWSGSDFKAGRFKLMRELILFDSVNRQTLGTVVLKIAPGLANHPILAKVTDFTITGGYSMGKIHVFAENPVTLLMADPANDMVALRTVGKGKVVQFGFASEYRSRVPLGDLNVRRLIFNAINF